MQPPILTDHVAARIEQALADTTISRLAPIQRLEGNPLGVEIRHLDHVLALLVRRHVAYYHYFNTVLGLGPGDEGLLDHLLAWYRGHGLRCRIGISPFAASDDLLRQLTTRGLQHSSFMTVLYGVPMADQPPPAAGVTVSAYQAPGLDPFVDLWTADAGEADQAFLQVLAQAEFVEWRCYVAYVDDQPAGVAALRVHDGVGSLAAGMTLPHFRARGCQTALLRRRLQDAAAAGCDLVVSQAAPGSTSQRNMERVGLRTAYTKAIWADQQG